MPIYRCEFSGGGKCLAGNTLEEARFTLESHMHQIAGTVAPPIRVKHKQDGNKLYECYQLEKAKGVILCGHKENPVKDWLN
ncbi:hypothetical protein [Vibrio phage D4]|nr:hypothetical protein vBVcaS_HC007 [Vibrio phage vB_VcaS_HC]UHD87230.1 hypothetical protein [Vibrio phage D4]WKV32856.1 hypothetical protein R21Y_95 [Vibrio phage vB_VhaS_R21Y]